MRKFKMGIFVKKIFFCLVTFIIFIFLISTFGEILVRVFKYKPFNEMTFFQFRQSDPVLDHSFIPNSRGRLGSKEYRTVYKIRL